MKSRYATTRPVRNRYLVRERDRRRLQELVRLTAATLLVGGALLAYTSLHLRLLASGYRVEALQVQLEELARLEGHLRLEEAYLSQPSRIEAEAASRLGMGPPRLAQMVFVPGGGP